MNSKKLDFSENVKSFFLKEKEANLGAYLYSTPLTKDDNVRGEEYYRKVIYEEPDYYLYQDEMVLIKAVANQLSAHVPTQATVVEFGPGTQKAFVGKTLPFLKAIPQLHQYIAIDLCEKYLLDSAEIIKNELPQVEVQTQQKDFFNQIYLLEDYTSPVVFFKGSTISNLSQEQCINFLRTIPQFLTPDGLLIVGLDANQDENSLKSAYDTKAVSDFILNIFHRIHRDLPIKEFDPNAFTYKYEWIPNLHCVKHKAISTKKQHFKLDNTPIILEQKEEFHIMSSFKYPVEFFQSMAIQASLVPVDYFVDSYQRMAIHVFKVKA